MKSRESKFFEKPDTGKEGVNEYTSGSIDMINILSHPDFVKTFPAPDDFQYEMLRNGFISSPESAQAVIDYLKKYIKETKNPTFCLTLFSRFLHTALGHFESAESMPHHAEILSILRKGFEEISNDPDIKYFLSVNLKPEVVLAPLVSMEKLERDLTPVRISANYFIQDNASDPIPIFYYAENPEDFLKVIEEQTKLFDKVRPEARAKFQNEPSIPESIELLRNRAKTTVHFDDKKEKIKEEKNKVAHRLLEKEVISFFPGVNNTYELTQDPAFYDFRVFIDPSVRKVLEKEFGVDFLKVPLKEQFYFLTTIVNKTNKEIDQVKSFTNDFKESGLRTFLSLEHGGRQMGEKILILGEKLPKKSAEDLFNKYGEIVEETENIGSFLAKNMGDRATPELIADAKERLLIQGKTLLEKYADRARSCQGQDCIALGKDISERLSLIKLSVFTFSAVCRVLVDKNEFSFENFKAAQLSFDKSPLTDKMQKEIISIHHENTKQYPEKLKDLWRGTLKEGLEKENPKQMFVSVVYDGAVVATMRVIEQEDGSWYGASFNVNPLVQGSRIGTELLKEVLNTLAKEKAFVADCYAENPMLDTYLNKFGFEITETYDNYQNTDAKVYQITIPPKG